MNHQMHHFDMGLWLLFLAYIVSVTGSVVGLACTRQSAAASDQRDRLRWLAMASIAIGGVAIWPMPVIAMLGFAIPNSVVRYNLGWTVASAALWSTLVLESPMLRFVAGLVMGVAVVGMHYTGMAAVRVTVDRTAPLPGGPEVFSFLFPVFVIGLLALAIPITAVMLASDRSAPESQSEPRSLAPAGGRHR